MTVLKQLQKLLKPIIQALSVICIILSGSGSAFSLSGEMLIIVLQDTGNPVEDHFKQSLLPGIRTVASDLGVELDVLTGNAALPEEVGITPLVVYQNHRGRSIYQGRTTTLDRIKNFIRTSRRIPQGKRKYTIEGRGRSR